MLTVHIYCVDFQRDHSRALKQLLHIWAGLEDIEKLGYTGMNEAHKKIYTESRTRR